MIVQIVLVGVVYSVSLFGVIRYVQKETRR
jgi:hypothetical protein